VIVVDGFTVNAALLLGPPAVVVTTTGPFDAPAGTTTPIDAAVQLVNIDTEVPLNVTELLSWVSPKFAPEIVTVDPIGPLSGVRLVIVVDGFTVKATPLLGPPAGVVTTTGPFVAPAGTITTIDDELQLETTDTGVPLKVTVLLPWLAPKFAPEIVTVDPARPLSGDRLEIVVDGFTVKATPLLGPPAAVVTTTGPFDAPAGTTTTIEDELQLVIEDTGVPLKVTVLLP